MGICVSSSSSKIQKDEYEDNVIFIEDNQFGAHGFSGLTSSLYSQQGSKPINQDSAIIYKGYGMEGAYLCGIFDGHGENGHKVSKLVKKHLSSMLLDHKKRITLENEDELIIDYMPNEWRRAYVNAFKQIDKELKLQDGFDCSCSGSTAVTIIKQGEDLVIANLGDSRAILGTFSDNKLKAIQLTVDLKPDLPNEAERIRKCHGRVFAHKDESDVLRVWSPDDDTMSLAMTRAFGDFHLKDYGVTAIPQISHRRLTDEDQFVVLATDGVWDALSNEEVASIVWSVDSEEEAAKSVVEAAVAVWKRDFPSFKVDDCTVACLFFQKKHHNS